MADDADNKQTSPTEEQVKTANELEMAKWEGDFPEEDLQVKYKREDEPNDKQTGNSNDNSAVSIPPKTDDEDRGAEDEQESETYSEPAPVVTVDDPGEYKPADYSFEVTLKDGKTKKVTTPEQAEELADDPDNFETPKQLMDFINKQNKMVRNLDRDHDKWESQKKTYDEQSAEETNRQETINNYASEFTYLIGKGLMPKIPAEFVTADWSDPQVAKQPGVKEQIELLDYLVKENGTRKKAGIKELNSIVDAYNAWQLDTGKKKQEEETKEAGEARKAAGSRVAGVSATAQQPFVPKGIAVGNPNVFKRNEAVWDD